MEMLNDPSTSQEIDDSKNNIDTEEKIDEDQIAVHIKEELTPFIHGNGLSDESSSELSLYKKTSGKKVFDKHAIDVGVASRIIKGIQEFNEACKEAHNIPSVTNLNEIINETDNKDITVSNAQQTNQTKSLAETLRETKKEEQTNVLPPLFTKVHQGLLELFELIDDGTESVTNIRVAAIKNEIERQKDDECERFTLEGFIAKKELEALEQYKVIDEKWEQISKLKDPLNIHNETILQRERCNTLLEEKDKVIQYLRETLDKKDKTFLKEVESQGIEIDLLIDRIEQQITTLKEAYTKQLETLADIIDEEKNMMIETNREKWEELIKNKSEVDKAILQKLSNIIDKHEITMRLAEKDHNEYQRKVRSKLNKYVNDLTVQVDHLKSICTLNIEKMTYNYQLLLKKQQENQLIKQQCRRYATRMKNNLNTLKKQIEKDSKNLANQIMENASSLDKLNDQIITMDKRCDSMAIANSKKYFDLWEFNEKKAINLIDQIFAADKILYEEILKVPWTPPDYTRLDRSVMPSYVSAMKVYNCLKSKDKVQSSKLPELQSKNGTEFERIASIVLESLKSSCPFFIDAHRKLEISHLPNKDQKLFELESIFEALGVKTKDDVEFLMKFFLKYITCGECVAASQDNKFDALTCSEMFEIYQAKKNYIMADKKAHEQLPQDSGEVSRASILPESNEKEMLQESSLLSDIVKDKINMATNVVIEETYNTKEIKNICPDESDEIGDHVDITLKEVILEKAKFFGLEISDFSLNCLSMEMYNGPLEQSDVNVLPCQEDKCIIICDDPSHHPYVNPLDIAKALRDFTIEFYKAKGKETNVSMEELMGKNRMSPSRMMNNDEVSKYWKSYTDFFTPDKVQLWESMLYAVQDYQKALHRRHHLNAEVTKLQKSNIELRRLLQRYVGESTSLRKNSLERLGKYESR